VRLVRASAPQPDRAGPDLLDGTGGPQVRGPRGLTRPDPANLARMDGSPDVIALLNEQLTAELTAINQYFLHAKMQEHWGYVRLATWTRRESIEEMEHAELLTNRILMLGGLPNYQRLLPLEVGQTVEEQLKADLALEYGVLPTLRSAATTCRGGGDIVSALLFEKILTAEEEHVDHLETELHLLTQLGTPLYLAQLRGEPGSGTPEPV
jgi:bacterioferritin